MFCFYTHKDNKNLINIQYQFGDRYKNSCLYIFSINQCYYYSIDVIYSNQLVNLQIIYALFYGFNKQLKTVVGYIFEFKFGF